MNTKNLHLLLSAGLLIPIALAYGFSPNVDGLLEFDVEAVDQKNILRAMMGLYIGMAGFWFYGVANENYWRAATIVNVIFMFGMAAGRILSMALDGLPTTGFVVGTIAELVLGFWGIVNLKRYLAN